ncbi:stage II sporulation protein M [Haladaptatus cibarius]|uniref:stage II sporulation protein M n=1 Tax=Haladaptatus cibarius TaxID=453847 RepID=UPI00067960EB|nr:stage II sporulation protein M [Haladaptatus cibarius]
MKFSDASSSVRAVLLSRPATILPVFLAGTSVGMVAQSVPIVGVVLAYLLLLGSGRIESVFTTIQGIDFNQSTLSEAESERIREAMMELVTPEVIAVLVLSVIGAIVVGILGRAVAEAAQVHTTTAALRNEPALPSGVAGASDDWWTFIKLAIVRVLAYLFLLAPVVVLTYLSITVSSALLLLAFLGGLLLIPGGFLIYLLFMFVPQAIVIDGVGVRTGIRRNGRFVWNNKARVGAYFVVVIGLVGIFGFVSFFFQLLGVGRLLGIAVAFFLLPTLGVLKTALYLDDATLEPRARGSVRGAFGRGLGELKSFVFGRLGLVALSTALFAAGTAGGWLATSQFALESLQTDVSQNVFGAIPVDTFVMLTANNWLVSISAAFSGLAFGAPTVVALVFNGLIVGAVVGLLPDTSLAVALIAPHGIIEIPALAIAGALGLHLGGSVWSYVRGSATATDLAGELSRAYYILLGLLPVFIVAAFIEAFVTWWVAAALT